MASRISALAAAALGLIGAMAQASETFDATSTLSDRQWGALENAEIVILGEIHDNPAHHTGQAALIAKLQPSAVVFEMLSPEQAVLANQTPWDNLNNFGDAIGWEAAGWPDFAIYAPIFAALGPAAIVGAAVPRQEVRDAFDAGAEQVFGADAARFGLHHEIDSQVRKQREQLQFDAHCAAMPREMMNGMVEAQRLRDARFAQSALAALDAWGAPVVVIAGNGHARRDWGVPAMLQLAAPDVRVMSVGFIEALEGVVDPRFDITLPTPSAERGDPCRSLQSQ